MATYAASIPLYQHAKRETAAMERLSRASADEAKAAGIAPEILEFVKYRASLLNGCSYCIRLHAHDARELGVAEERLVALGAWEDSDLFDAHERAALGLTDAMTRQADLAGVDPDAISAATKAFGEAAASHLALAVTVINAWNRIGVVGALQPDAKWGAAPEPI